MKLDRNSKFIRMLENALKQWKNENRIERPFFYVIDHKHNHLLLYSDKPSDLIKARDDLEEIMDIADLRFRDFKFFELKGGTIY